LSRKIHAQFATKSSLPVLEFAEIPGQGIKGLVNGSYVILGSEYFVAGTTNTKNALATKVFVMIDGELFGYFSFDASYRDGLSDLIKKLRSTFSLCILSGDTAGEAKYLETVFGKETEQYFNQTPEEKKSVIQNLRKSGKNVMMIGDGLNDAVALRQSDVGIAVSDDTNNFSPACDAILDGTGFTKLLDFIELAKSGKNIIVGTFILSLIYNAIGLFFAVQGILSPVIAAILMPVSSVTIVLIATLSTTIVAKKKGL
jgi:Cu+-exporting ATPase